MNNNFLKTAKDHDREVILRFLCEENKNVTLYLNKEVNEYLMEKYPTIFTGYDEWDRLLIGKFISKKEDNFSQLLCSIEKVSNFEIGIVMKEHFSGDSTAYNDSQFIIWNCTNHLNGIRINIPLRFICEINLLD